MSREVNRLIQRALQPQQPAVPRPIIHRRAVVDRDHVAAHQRLYEDYFAPEPRFGANLFRRRFRMRRELFMRIVDALERRYLCFRFRYDAAGRPGHTAIQKCTAAIRQLADGSATDMWDEYLHIGKTIALDLSSKPYPENCQDLMQMHE
ncbi:uncharacterized protein LOC125215238 [Salvia hispanica]|uniref:uncharacterized protein LOC125215238 n=1 Tax=Salvia hispanica TaxID=49212 RepID=UPI002009B534|nr:uncharacterized protein LOC125215238 [Salvia hispanica]